VVELSGHDLLGVRWGGASRTQDRDPGHAGKDAPFGHPQLRVPLQPVRFIEYLLENDGGTAVFCDEGSLASKEDRVQGQL
jgi:hypothetical protein